MVARREVLEQIGGLEQIGFQVTDDIPLSRAILKEGYQIHLLKEPARVFHRQDSFSGWWSHMLRWLVIIRQYWPLKSFLKNLVMVAPWWSLLYMMISLVKKESIYTGVLLFIAVLATSLISTVVVNLKFVGCKKIWRFLWVVPLFELCRLPLIVHSYLTNEVSWRGRNFRLNKDGTISFTV
jgi:ceramide glucosyltransferase